MKRHAPARQRGVTLVVALMLLLAVTLLGLASMRSTGMQERMSANLYDRAIAFQAAESSLREAETLLAAGTLGPFDGTVTGLYGKPAPGGYRIPQPVGGLDRGVGHRKRLVDRRRCRHPGQGCRRAAVHHRRPRPVADDPRLRHRHHDRFRTASSHAIASLHAARRPSAGRLSCCRPPTDHENDIPKPDVRAGVRAVLDRAGSRGRRYFRLAADGRQCRRAEPDVPARRFGFDAVGSDAGRQDVLFDLPLSGARARLWRRHLHLAGTELRRQQHPQFLRSVAGQQCGLLQPAIDLPPVVASYRCVFRQCRSRRQRPTTRPNPRAERWI
jgi:hypothetical protein